METKELSIIKAQVTKCTTVTTGITVTNQEEYDRAYEIGKKVSSLLKMIDEKEKAITKPINDSLKQIRDMFRPYKTQVENEKARIASILNDYTRAEAAKKKLAEDKLVARLEKGTMKEETVVRKLAEIETPDTTGRTTSVLKVTLVDISKVPAKYLILNEALIKEDYRANGVQIEGTISEYVKTTRF